LQFRSDFLQAHVYRRHSIIMQPTADSPRRARSVAEMRAMFDQLFASAGSVQESIATWRPRPTDVVISPFSKCGTTWLQQIFHTLRTRGDTDFDDISRVVPWIETALLLELDLEAPQKAEPRGFKSHLPFHMLPAGAKAIVALRDPKDALVSIFRFMEGWFLEPGSVTLDEFAPSRLDVAPDTGYFGHLLSWWAQRHNPAVLLMTYEQMSADPQGTIQRVAAFCDIALDDELLALVRERSSLAWMLQHKSQFADPMMHAAAVRLCGLPDHIGTGKVRRGKVGGHTDDMSPALSARVDQRWRELVTPALGFQDYAELDAALAREARAGRLP
jgi:hypothetical protein